jgi:hypothetical protein
MKKAGRIEEGRAQPGPAPPEGSVGLNAFRISRLLDGIDRDTIRVMPDHAYGQPESRTDSLGNYPGSGILPKGEGSPVERPA